MTVSLAETDGRNNAAAQRALLLIIDLVFIPLTDIERPKELDEGAVKERSQTYSWIKRIGKRTNLIMLLAEEIGADLMLFQGNFYDIAKVMK